METIAKIRRDYFVHGKGIKTIARVHARRWLGEGPGRRADFWSGGEGKADIELEASIPIPGSPIDQLRWPILKLESLGGRTFIQDCFRLFPA